MAAVAQGAPSIDSMLVSPGVSLPAIASDQTIQLRFWHWFQLPSGVDCGLNWSQEAHVLAQEQTGPGVWGPWTELIAFNGSSGGIWTSPSVDLSGFAGKRIRIAFRFYSQVQNTGWYVDDITLSVVPLLKLANGGTFQEGFEAGLGAWWVTDGLWEAGAPTAGPSAAHSGTSVAATLLGGPYPKSNTALVSPAIALPVGGADEQIYLRFWQWFDFSPSCYHPCNWTRINDYGSVFVQELTAPGQWSGRASLYSVQGYCGGTWSYPLIDLSTYAGKTIRFGFSMGQYVCGGGLGWYVDDVALTATGG